MKNKKSWFSPKLTKQIGLLIGTAGIVIGIWDKTNGIWFVITGMWLYLVLGDLE